MEFVKEPGKREQSLLDLFYGIVPPEEVAQVIHQHGNDWYCFLRRKFIERAYRKLPPNEEWDNSPVIQLPLEARGDDEDDGIMFPEEFFDELMTPIFDEHCFSDAPYEWSSVTMSVTSTCEEDDVEATAENEATPTLADYHVQFDGCAPDWLGKSLEGVLPDGCGLYWATLTRRRAKGVLPDAYQRYFYPHERSQNGETIRCVVDVPSLRPLVERDRIIAEQRARLQALQREVERRLQLLDGGNADATALASNAEFLANN